MEKTCINGHAPIKYNVISLAPGAVNELLSDCPLCKFMKDYSKKFSGDCVECCEFNTHRISHSSNNESVGPHPDIVCDNCGGQIQWDYGF